MCALKAHISHFFLETFVILWRIEKVVKKKLVTFIFFIKSFLKWFINTYSKNIH